MRNKTKRVFWGFFSLDYKAMETYLEKMAQEGWMLEKVGRFTAKFKAIEPQNLKFYVDLFKDGGPFSGENHDYVKDYRGLCEETGWHYITSQDYLQFFYAQGDQNPTPIQTDELLEQNIVQTSLWKQELWGVLALFFALIIVANVYLFPIKYTNLLSFTGVAGTFVYPLLGIPMLFMGVYILGWMLKAKKSVKMGLPLKRPTLKDARRRGIIFNGLALILLSLSIIAFIVDVFFTPFITNIALLPLVVGLGIGFLSRYLIKKKSRNRGESTFIGFFAVITAVFVMIIMSTWTVSNIGVGSNNNSQERIIPSIDPIIIFEELSDNHRGVFVGSEFRRGMSPVVPKHYDYWETYNFGGTRKGVRINYFDTIHPYFAQMIFEGKTEEMSRFRKLAWVDEDMRQLWGADRLVMTEKMDAILIQRGSQVLYISGEVDFNEQEIRRVIIERFFEEHL
ncbi:MAG: DUF2812 domain-containing protein [Bacillota bacterium]